MLELRAAQTVEQHGLRGRRALAVPGAIALACLAVLAAEQMQRLNTGAALAAAGLVCALAWFAFAVAHNMRALANSRRDSLTDALTGLRNRRSLQDDLEDALSGATDERPTVLVLLDLDGFKQYNDTFGHPAGDTLLARLAASLKQAVAPTGRHTAWAATSSARCSPLRERKPPISRRLQPPQCARAAVASRSRPHTASRCSPARLTLQPRAASGRPAPVREQVGRRRSGTAEQIRDALVQALEERQPELRGRLDGVAALTRAVARAMGLSSDDIDVLVRAAELHDVGKVAVPEAILAKPGPLDAVEWGFVRQHTIVGERILSAAPALVPVAKLVRSSHERYDGTGYPDGLVGDEIPLGARIISVCDAYHAMTSARPYERALPRDEALRELSRCAGEQFDATVVRSFCDLVGSLPADVAVASMKARRLLVAGAILAGCTFAPAAAQAGVVSAVGTKLTYVRLAGSGQQARRQLQARRRRRVGAEDHRGGAGAETGGRCRLQGKPGRRAVSAIEGQEHRPARAVTATTSSTTPPCCPRCWTGGRVTTRSLAASGPTSCSVAPGWIQPTTAIAPAP